jgi:hypothetical protein
METGEMTVPGKVMVMETKSSFTQVILGILGIQVHLGKMELAPVELIKEKTVAVMAEATPMEIIAAMTSPAKVAERSP